MSDEDRLRIERYKLWVSQWRNLIAPDLVALGLPAVMLQGITDSLISFTDEITTMVTSQAPPSLPVVEPPTIVRSA